MPYSQHDKSTLFALLASQPSCDLCFQEWPTSSSKVLSKWEGLQEETKIAPTICWWPCHKSTIHWERLNIFQETDLVSHALFRHALSFINSVPALHRKGSAQPLQPAISTSASSSTSNALLPVDDCAIGPMIGYLATCSFTTIVRCNLIDLVHSQVLSHHNRTSDTGE